jgi:plasmid segregation protein ParM
MNVGLDVGYSAVKGVSGNRRVQFPSAVGTPEKGRFSLNGGSSLVLLEPHHVQVGAGAVEQSRFLHRREDRQWIESDEWYALFLAALTELTRAKRAGLCLVTGLPVSYFGDREKLRERLLGSHTVRREGRHAQTLQVDDVKVIPQPFGALLAQTLDRQGRIADQDLAAGTVGVIDVGGKTTNLLSVSKLSEISRETASVNVGAWDAVRAVKTWLTEEHPDLDLRDHQVAEAIQARRVVYYGEPIDITQIVEDTLAPLANQVCAEASQLWSGAAGINAVLIAGGGACLLGDAIAAHFPHSRLVEEPVFANALGYWRFAQRLGS